MNHQKVKNFHLKPQWDTTSHLSEWLASERQHNKRWWGRALLVGLHVGEATMENRIEAPQEIKNRTAYDLVTSLLGIYPKKTKS